MEFEVSTLEGSRSSPQMTLVIFDAALFQSLRDPSGSNSNVAQYRWSLAAARTTGYRPSRSGGNAAFGVQHA